MSNNSSIAEHRTRSIISLVASIILGLILGFAGIGKILGIGEMPGQALAFLSEVLPGFLFTPEVAYFIGYVLLPYIIPAAELALGIFLLLGIWPRLMAVLSLPLTMAYMADNSWLISIGMKEFPSCACFGIWEKMFGTLTPLQSLCIDIGLFLLALTIIFAHPGGFLASPAWATSLSKKLKPQKK
jgi:uncharacterized membrane protein YphA (DoxX/SURF4 family)